MKKARIENGVVREVLDLDPFPPFAPELIWVECGIDVQEGWLHDGTSFSAPPSPSSPTPEQMRKMCSDAIDQHLDAFANTWGYKTLERAAGYTNSTNPKFKAEANALVAWRDAIWIFSEQMDAAVLAGTQPAPVSVEAFIATLPAAPARPV